MQLSSPEISKIDTRRSYTIEELENLPKLNWLIKDILVDGGIATIYGESGSSKSFLAIDLALHLASGSEWFGLPVSREIPVVYTALEGFRGVAKRIKGWCKKNGTSPTNMLTTHDTLLLGQNGSVDDFINHYKKKQFHSGMVIIDTLNMACPNIEENSASEMSGVIRKAKLITEQLNSTVLIIHHSGKDESRGMRGSSSLKASMDTIIFVKKDSNGNFEWTLEKSKDSECGIRYGYRLETLELDVYGEVETTCTVEKLGEILEKSKNIKLTSKQIRVLNLLKDRLLPLSSGHDDMDIVIEQCCNLWTEHPSAKRTYDMRIIIGNLVNKGLVGTGSRGNLSDQVWITDKGMKE
jgi:hypothetical protein